jgi:hypothetical protein
VVESSTLNPTAASLTFQNQCESLLPQLPCMDIEGTRATPGADQCRGGGQHGNARSPHGRRDYISRQRAWRSR